MPGVGGAPAGRPVEGWGPSPPPAAAGAPPPPPLFVSASPPPSMKVSSPAPPRRESLPAPPDRPALGAAPSSPAPPSIVSAPPLPSRRLSSPAPPSIVSPAAPPCTSSLPSPAVTVIGTLVRAVASSTSAPSLRSADARVAPGQRAPPPTAEQPGPGVIVSLSPLLGSTRTSPAGWVTLMLLTLPSLAV